MPIGDAMKSCEKSQQSCFHSLKRGETLTYTIGKTLTCTTGESLTPFEVVGAPLRRIRRKAQKKSGCTIVAHPLYG